MRALPANGREQSVLAAVLRGLLERRVPGPAEASRLTGLDETAVGEGLTALVRIGAVVVDPRGKILAAYPLSAIPTRHVVHLGAAAPWANCAIDALAVPAMVGRAGTIRSACAHCGADITVEVDGTQVLGAHPEDGLVAYGGLADCIDRPSLEARCPYINFFCNSAHARAWERPEAWQGRLLSLGDAVELAVERFAPIIEIYRSCMLPAQD